jgi:hypothetical protein
MVLVLCIHMCTVMCFLYTYYLFTFALPYPVMFALLFFTQSYFLPVLCLVDLEHIRIIKFLDCFKEFLEVLFMYSCLPYLNAVSCMGAGMELTCRGLELCVLWDVVVGSQC